MHDSQMIVQCGGGQNTDPKSKDLKPSGLYLCGLATEYSSRICFFTPRQVFLESQCTVDILKTMLQEVRADKLLHDFLFQPVISSLT